MEKSQKRIIGRLERVDIPKWDLYGIEAKVDTGAYTSSLHCHEINLKGDKSVVAIKLLDPSYNNYKKEYLKLPVHEIRKVKSSNGLSEKRIIVDTTIVLASTEINTVLSLTDRSNMRYPLLIGRRTLQGQFLVDVDKNF